MRLAAASLLAFGLVVPALHAQTPDSIAWRRYFPLAVGNAWEYVHEDIQPPNPLTPSYHHTWAERYAVVARQARAADTLYAVTRQFTEQEGKRPGVRDTVWVRYDEAHAGLMVADSPSEPLLRPVLRLNAPLDGPGYGVWGRSESPAPFPASFAAKMVADLVYGGTFVADIGMLRASGGCEPCTAFDGYETWRLVRATVGGTTYEVGQTTVAADRPRTAEAIMLHPSVTRTASTLRLAAPSTVEAFDVTGRRVYRAEATAGEHRIDVAAWAPGLYVVRAGGETRRLVVVR